MNWLIGIFLPVLVIGSGTLCAAEVKGKPRVVDGDTLVVEGRKIRFSGIDAPETDQVCLDQKGAKWTCGIEARDQLARKIGTGSVVCDLTAKDVYGRDLGSCRLGDEDLQRWLVREGLALSYTKYSRAYEADERAAQTAKAGMWAGAFIAPWDWRHSSTQTEIKGSLAVPVTAQAQLLSVAATNAPSTSECVIKGNVNRSGERIYHVPGAHSYSATRMDKGTGERWFCTVAEAEAAGWRRAKR